MMHLPPCLGCGVGLRTRNEPRQIGVHLHGAGGYCYTCHRRRKRSPKAAAPLRLYKPEPWTVSAACASVDAELFFPEYGEGAAELVRDAKRVCAGCPARTECLTSALERGEEHGVWGGLTPVERYDLTHGGAA